MDPIPRSSAGIRDCLKVEIKRRVQWLSNDCSTFWRVRLERTKWYSENATTDSGLGGGNYVMALAMLSACAFLAKAHLYLVKPEAFVTADDQNAVKKAKAIVKQHCPGLKRLLDSSKTNWMQPKIGSCNETEAFGRLIEALQREGIDLGLPPTEARAVWDRFRNKLAHMAYPEGVVEFCGATAAKTLDEARAAIRRLPAFRVHDGRWVCNADRLSLDVLKIADWLCEKVGRCTKLDRIKKLAEWVSEDIEPAPSQDPDRDNH